MMIISKMTRAKEFRRQGVKGYFILVSGSKK